MKGKRDLKVYLEDIIESASIIEDYLTDISEGEFIKSSQKQDAIIRRIQIIGEAAKHIPDDFRLNWPSVPWKDIAGMRDIIVHEYFGITLGMIWKTAVEDIPVMKIQIIEIVSRLNQLK